MDINIDVKKCVLSIYDGFRMIRAREVCFSGQSMPRPLHIDGPKSELVAEMHVVQRNPYVHRTLAQIGAMPDRLSGGGTIISRPSLGVGS